MSNEIINYLVQFSAIPVFLLASKREASAAFICSSWDGFTKDQAMCMIRPYQAYGVSGYRSALRMIRVSPGSHLLPTCPSCHVCCVRRTRARRATIASDRCHGRSQSVVDRLGSQRIGELPKNDGSVSQGLHFDQTLNARLQGDQRTISRGDLREVDALKSSRVVLYRIYLESCRGSHTHTCHMSFVLSQSIEYA